MRSLPEVCLLDHFTYTGEQEHAGKSQRAFPVVAETELHPTGNELPTSPVLDLQGLQVVSISPALPGKEQLCDFTTTFPGIFTDQQLPLYCQG